MVEPAGDHVALFDVWHRKHGAVECLQARPARIGMPQPDKGEMRLIQANGAIASR
ncbi:hypothetical protein [Fuscibacter oryzae]|uniref:Uncharacterized protein n=1 Tax=Fuscibacter oryzae TaxID=2803939 RepID=A0A8J7MMZ7_9RHOB|nr:hypothetical protein [Fuscibacter oryzae]MBL4926628.1 hypothetical protein [Fuscibacter oryzae]